MLNRDLPGDKIDDKADNTNNRRPVQKNATNPLGQYSMMQQNKHMPDQRDSSNDHKVT